MSAAHKSARGICTETNRHVYNILWKHYLEHQGRINCSYCPYHRNENVTRCSRHQSWKKFRKTQYK